MTGVQPRSAVNSSTAPLDLSAGDDFDELHRWIGSGRQTYDEAMAWIERWDLRGNRRHPDHEQERQRPMGRVRGDAKEGIAFI